MDLDFVERSAEQLLSEESYQELLGQSFYSSELKNLLAETLEENKNLKDRVLHFESSKDVNQKQGKRSIKRGKTIDKVRSMHTSPSHSKLIHARERLATTAP